MTLCAFLYRESKKKHVQLIKDRKVFEAKITEMEKECEEMMVGKFGCIVDLEKLETVTVNRTIEELKEKLRMTEIQCAEDVQEWNVSNHRTGWIESIIPTQGSTVSVGNKACWIA